MAEVNETLVSLLRPLGRRLRRQDALLLATRTLWLAFLGAVLVQIVGRLVPLERRLLWSMAPLVIWAAVILGYALLRRQPLERVARRVDAEIGLKERLATALMLGDWKDGRMGKWRDGRLAPLSSLPIFQPSLLALQRQDALSTAQAIDPRHALPLCIARRPLALAAALLLAASLLAFLPNPMDDVLVRRAAVREELERQAEEVEALQEEIQGREDLSPEDGEELLKQLEDLVKELRANRGDPEEALADLSRVEEALRQKLDPQAGAREAALKQMAADLASLSGGSGDRRPQDTAEMAERLQELAEQLEEMEAGEREALAQALERMASRVAPTDASLAQALASLAEAARQGDNAAAAQAARTAAGALSQAASDLATQQALNRALSQLQRSSRQVARSGQRGQASASGPGMGQGQGQGQGQGRGGQGGTSARTLPPGQWPGRMGEPDRPNRPEAVDDLDQVYAPWLRPGGEGEQEFIPGRESAGGETTVRTERDPLPGAEIGALVPYGEVYATYQEAAAQAMEREYIPTGLRDYVREYFSRLEP